SVYALLPADWITSRQAELIGWAMSAWSLARPSASRTARCSSSLCPQLLQYRARRWFLHPHPTHRSVSFRLGMATNEPFVPSMILRSRTTKALSNVTEQNAWSRSLFSATSLIRASGMTTAVLLDSRWRPGGAGGGGKHAPRFARRPGGPGRARG